MSTEIKKYEETDNNRLVRKLENLMNSHPGRDLLSILKEFTTIKDEFISLLDLSDSKLEYYVDLALAKS
ncbi:hypothetical protein JXA48_01775 [Candidatus Woesearchaeota archaeon]|nr:hypothetical protein [Candidatus Woesearchaeota archaeon]